MKRKDKLKGLGLSILSIGMLIGAAYLLLKLILGIFFRIEV